MGDMDSRPDREAVKNIVSAPSRAGAGMSGGDADSTEKEFVIPDAMQRETLRCRSGTCQRFTVRDPVRGAASFHDAARTG